MKKKNVIPKFLKFDPNTIHRILVNVMALIILTLSFSALADADNRPTLNETYQERIKSGQTMVPLPAENTGRETGVKTKRIEEKWGIKVTSVRLSAHDHMIDFRYRVLNAARAKELFVRQNKPALIHQKTGKVLVVPDTAKIGPLRNSYNPREGKIYWMFFANAGQLVKAGDKISVTIGDFKVKDIVVQ